MGKGLLPIMTTVITEANKVARAFSGKDADGLSERARELSGNLGDSGAGSLGRSLKVLADSFAKLFKAFTDDGDQATDAMQETADALITIANAINSVATAYSKAKSAINWLNKPGSSFQNFGGLKGLPNPFAKPPGMAAGGSVMAGQAVRVGEFGSEIFVPSGSGSIRKDPGGGGNTFIFNGVVDGESARRSIERLLQSSARRTGAVNFAGVNL
jgi:flagellar hook-basal body complex protein FliE